MGVECLRLPVPSLPGSVSGSAFMGAFLRDRAKGNGSVALASSRRLFCFGSRVTCSGVQCGRCYCEGKSAPFWLRAGSIHVVVARTPPSLRAWLFSGGV